MRKILIAEDEKDIRNILKIYLSAEGYEVIEAENGKQAVQRVDDSISAVLLDIMMPEMTGTEACMKIREKYHMPIIFLTAKIDDIDKVSGLAIGADDYITKPFNPIELIARIKANIRRFESYRGAKAIEKSKVLEIENLVIDLDAHKVLKDGKSLTLTKTEFAILRTLVVNRGKVFSLEHIYQKVWGEDSILGAENTVAVHIKKIREKIEDNIKKPTIIKTVWGVGYRVD